MTTNLAWDPGQSLCMKAHRDGDAMVVSCSGRLTSDTADGLRGRVRGLIPHEKHIVLDLNHLKYMDSSGLGAIVGLYVSATGAHCDLELVNLGKQVYQLFKITNVVSMFETCGRYLTKMP
jgi:anti-sigma B factor antagonist